MKWNFQKGDKYLIEWIDTYGEENWTSEEELIKKENSRLLVIKTIGFIVYLGKDYLIVANTHNEFCKYNWCGSNFIPRNSILKMSKLK